jgi:succinate dehydrogenase / fumarate reductase, membrane anchor subunit
VTEKNHSIRTPMGRVRSLGAARAGTRHFWQQRVTSVAGIPLTVAFLILFLAVLGRNHAAVVQILASPVAVIVLILFVVTNAYHMWLGMQVVIEDYVHDEVWKFASLMANTFFCVTVALACVYAALKLSFGV